MSRYTAPPPSYSSRSPASWSSSQWDGQQVRKPVYSYGDTKSTRYVAESAPEIRRAFVRKVYSIFVCQILATIVLGGLISQSTGLLSFVHAHSWVFYIPLVATVINIFALIEERHNYPSNFFLLGTFTLLEAFTLGIFVSWFDIVVVLQTLVITLGAFVGLTLYTLQWKYDFSGMGPFLLAALSALTTTGLVNIFMPFGSTTELITIICGCVLFSFYIVFDTYMIFNKLSPDEYIMGALSLYLDLVNLFIKILQILDNNKREERRRRDRDDD